MFPEDLADLEELGLVPSSDSSDTETEADNKQVQTPTKEGDTPMAEPDAEEVVATHKRETVGGVSWFDTLMEGSRLGGRMRMTKGRRTNRSGSVRVEWEVVEWSDDGEDEAARNGKRKLADRESGSSAGAMEEVRRHG